MKDTPQAASLDVFEKSGRSIGDNGGGRVPITKDVPLAA
jgi:hypothetical protein